MWRHETSFFSLKGNVQFQGSFFHNFWSVCLAKDLQVRDKLQIRLLTDCEGLVLAVWMKINHFTFQGDASTSELFKIDNIDVPLAVIVFA